MKRNGLIAIAGCAFFLLSTARAAVLAPSELERAVFLSMVLDTNYEKSRIGVRILSQRYPGNDELCDYVAEKLLKEPPSSSGAATDAISWYVRVLDESCRPRYRDTLTLVRQRQTNEKIVKYLDLALAKPASAPAMEQYKEGAADLLSAQVELLEMLGARQQAKGAGAGFAPGATLGEVLDRAGIPRELTSMTLRIAKYGRSTALAAHYDGTGLLMFRRQGAAEWVLADVFDELFPVGDTYKGSQFSIAQSLSALRGQALRMFIKANARAIRRDRELLWALTRRVSVSPFPSDKFEADGLQVGFKVIAGSRNPEVLAMLKMIAESPGDDAPPRARAYIEKFERQGALPPAEEAAEDPQAEDEQKE
jgi:hypothetical protein